MKPNDIGLFIARLGVGLTLVFYGSQKVFGLFGGFGYNATLQFFDTKYHIPALFATLAMAGELLGGLGLIFGLLTRVAAFGAFCTMSVAWFMTNHDGGNFTKMMSGDGMAASAFYYTLTLGLSALAIVLTGGGNLSLDAKIFGKKRSR